MANIKIKDRKETNLLCIKYTGHYEDIPYDDYFKMLRAWAKENKARPYSKPMGIFYDDPSEVKPEKRTAEVGIPIKKKRPTTGSMHMKYLPSMKVAQIKYKGTSEDVKKVYHEIYDWIKSEGYRPTGAPMEIYKSKTKIIDGKKVMKGVIQVPIHKSK